MLHGQIAAAAFDVSESAIEQGLGLLDTASNHYTGAEVKSIISCSLLLLLLKCFKHYVFSC